MSDRTTRRRLLAGVALTVGAGALAGCEQPPTEDTPDDAEPDDDEPADGAASPGGDADGEATTADGIGGTPEDGGEESPFGGIGDGSPLGG